MGDDNKSFVGKVAAVSGRTPPPIVVDCSGKNLEDLLFETKLTATEDELGVVEGPLVQAHKQNRPIHLTNVDQCQQGTDASFCMVLQALSGEVPSHKVMAGQGHEHVFEKGARNFSLTIEPTTGSRNERHGVGNLGMSTTIRLGYFESRAPGAVDHVNAERATGNSKGHGIS